MVRRPDVYTHGHHESVLRSHSWRTVENSAAYLLADLRAGVRVLDVGCGPGTITVDMARRVAPGSVLGIDRSPDIVAQARAEAERAGVGNVGFDVGDVYALAHDDRSFDVVHAHQVLQHLSDPTAALIEMRRVVAADGVVGVRDADYGAMAWGPADSRLDRWLEIYRAVARHNEAEPDAARHLPSWAQAAGFAEIEETTDVWRFDTPPARAWWGELWAERITQSAMADQAVRYGLATTDELEEIAVGWRHWSSADDGWFEVPNGQLRCRE